MVKGVDSAVCFLVIPWGVMYVIHGIPNHVGGIGGMGVYANRKAIELFCKMIDGMKEKEKGKKAAPEKERTKDKLEIGNGIAEGGKINQEEKE